MLQVKYIQEQVKQTSDVKREMKLSGIDGIEINHIKMFYPHWVALNYYVKIDYNSQKIVAIGPMNVMCEYCKLKNEHNSYTSKRPIWK